MCIYNGRQSPIHVKCYVLCIHNVLKCISNGNRYTCLFSFGAWYLKLKVTVILHLWYLCFTNGMAVLRLTLFNIHAFLLLERNWNSYWNQTSERAENVFEFGYGLFESFSNFSCRKPKHFWFSKRIHRQQFEWTLHLTQNTSLLTSAEMVIWQFKEKYSFLLR